ncbi:Rne/Rng family ribonuclease [Roseobacter sp. HKCCD9010]|uniref:ribonuclease E/G n=1 Tax=unclassified Roseobacter TaxID=196798 RepID=UPI00149324FC|nr:MULTISPECIES: ribonuclease E/G [unclassified Roseobacter]MBF9050717.1 Rne/Rng family ribonuclease [Rhodobacterales bacterium HKCCD4356]NNV11865.1 Rne/Rng family ribonuclease [Roseobacter sp. HKCCD7357]NNV18016.1 Rne/Rng family ribonuclease [Roseobacter sp. HKCCD8768]NNV26107.1 Rne/Rng family ribonuclease [Roseobacter sp. HKCCD8192]NNV31743.1 Rne/Rng family ribonuclease [Roseobacter sp. HKCCD9061]
MAKKMLIDATHAEETRVVVADGNRVEEFDFESLNKRQLAGNIYLAKVTRVEPSLQAAFVDYGGNRHGFLAFSEIHPDYYQIPTADREALLAEEREYAEAMAASEEEPRPKRSRGRRRRKSTDTKAEATKTDAVTTGEAKTPSGMDVVDLGDEEVVATDLTDTSEANAGEAAKAEPDTAAETPEAEVAEADPADEVVAEAEASETDEANPDTAKDASEPEADDGADAADEPDVEGDTEQDDAEQDGTEDDAQAADDDVDTVADDDDQEDIRPVRKPRPRKYKIQEVVKVRQILLVQVVKEERGNKGAALTTYLSLAGRYCVLMPNTARGGGISRKITNAADRKKLKEIATGLDVPQGAGLIVRTAGAKRTKAEIKRDYEYLQRQWEQVRALTLKSTAPAPIYEEGNLIHRSIRDLYNREIDEVLVEGDAGYRQAKDFMKMIMPSHAKNVKHYTDPMPLFARHKVEGYLADMFNPVVQLKSGGYIVIGVTEALVAIDVNSGRATKEGSIEETATKTNLEAAEEVARQLRLRDLAGLIVIDFIDMDDRRNNSAVEKRIKEKLKTDRARIQVGRISAFGLMEMSRQRLRPGMLEATTQPCHACHGTGLVRSDDSLALSILRQLEEEGTRRRSREVLLTAPVGIVNFIMNAKREYLAEIEARYGLSVRIEADPHLVAPDYKIEKFKTATRRVPDAAPIVSMDAALMDEIEDDTASDEAETPEAAETEENGTKRKRRRRRGGRGRRKSNGDEAQTNGDAEAEDTAEAATAQVDAEEAPAAEASDAPVEEEAKPKRRRSRGGRGRKKATEADASEGAAEAPAEAEPGDATDSAEPETQPEPAPEPVPEPAMVEAVVEAQEAAPEPEPVVEEAAAEPQPAPEPQPEPEPVAVVADDSPPKPKRKGWWSIG